MGLLRKSAKGGEVLCNNNIAFTFAGLRLSKQTIFNSKQYKQRKKKGAKKFGAAKKARGVKAKTQTGVYAYIQTEKKGTVF